MMPNVVSLTRARDLTKKRLHMQRSHSKRQKCPKLIIQPFHNTREMLRGLAMLLTQNQKALRKQYTANSHQKRCTKCPISSESPFKEDCYQGCLWYLDKLKYELCYSTNYTICTQRPINPTHSKSTTLTLADTSHNAIRWSQSTVDQSWQALDAKDKWAEWWV